MAKCKHKGAIIKPNGVHELDPCLYRDVVKYRNVTVTVAKCERCGNIDISWEIQENTETIDLTREAKDENKTD